MGNRPPRSLSLGYRLSEIFDSCYWLLHEMDWSGATLFHHGCTTRKFVWRNIFTRFEIRESLITDNGTQFVDRKFRDLLSSYRVRHHFTSVEHPQANGQVEAANKVILHGLKKRLDDKKGAWADELGSVLWSYRTTPHSTMGESPFKLTYGVDAMIPIEVGEPSPRLIFRNTNSQSMREELDLSGEAREMAYIRK